MPNQSLGPVQVTDNTELAINDALRPFNARVTAQPATPERILKALGKG